MSGAALSQAGEPTPAPIEAQTPDEIERAWLENVYAGDHIRQLTARSVVTGMLLGGLMALSNLYVSLKTGISLGVTITAAILAFGVWSLIGKVFPRMVPFGPLENNAMQSVASSAGYMTGGGTVAAIPALMMVTGYQFKPLTMVLWIGSLAMLGIFVAIPLKRQMVNIEQLRFPTGLASAMTVRSLHAQDREATTQARGLGLAAAFGALVAIVRDGLKLFPERFAIFGKTAASYTLQADGSVLLIGAGAIMGIRAAISQLVGALLCYGVLAPWARGAGAITGEIKFKNIVSWSVWIGSSMMLTAGLLHFALQWKSMRRAFIDLALLFRFRGQGTRQGDDPLARVEVPARWFAMGMFAFGPLVIFLQRALFGIPIWMGILTLLLSLLVAIVAARSTGETDTTPTGAMGKLVQLIFGAVHPGNMTTNLMTAQASAGVAIHASDLLTDLKSGHVLGAKPRHQFFAQFFGVIAGSLVVVPAYLLLIPDVSALGDDKFPAPAAQSWAAVAQLLASGLGSVHVSARWGMLFGGLTGIVLELMEHFFPKHKRFFPSPMALGLAFTLPAWNTISMAFGATAAFVLEKRRPALAALFVIAVSSGLIAGESLSGVFLGLYQALR